MACPFCIVAIAAVVGGAASAGGASAVESKKTQEIIYGVSGAVLTVAGAIMVCWFQFGWKPGKATPCDSSGVCSLDDKQQPSSPKKPWLSENAGWWIGMITGLLSFVSGVVLIGIAIASAMKEPPPCDEDEKTP